MGCHQAVIVISRLLMARLMLGLEPCRDFQIICPDIAKCDATVSQPQPTTSSARSSNTQYGQDSWIHHTRTSSAGLALALSSKVRPLAESVLSCRASSLAALAEEMKTNRQHLTSRSPSACCAMLHVSSLSVQEINQVASGESDVDFYIIAPGRGQLGDVRLVMSHLSKLSPQRPSISL